MVVVLVVGVIVVVVVTEVVSVCSSTVKVIGSPQAIMVRNERGACMNYLSQRKGPGHPGTPLALHYIKLHCSTALVDAKFKNAQNATAGTGHGAVYRMYLILYLFYLGKLSKVKWIAIDTC